MLDVIADLIHRPIPNQYGSRRGQEPAALFQHCQRIIDVMEQVRHEDDVE